MEEMLERLVAAIEKTAILLCKEELLLKQSGRIRWI